MQRFPPSARAFPVVLQRNSFGPRLVARAGDAWRGIQDVVVDQSSSVGWTPERYHQTGTMFVVRSMTVTHARELRFGEALVGRTWPSGARRDMFFSREVRLFAGGELVTSASQEWVYLGEDLAPRRAGADIYDAFHLEAGFPRAELPASTPLAGAPVHRFALRTWHTWMDAFAHLNHPTYVDFCDEATSQVLARGGLDAQRLSAVAESVHFRLAITADVEVAVETQLTGRVGEDAAVLSHRILSNGKVCATATTVRRLAGATDRAWLGALGAP